MQHDIVIRIDASKDTLLDKQRALDLFLADIERKAFRIAEIAVGNRDEALDIVQDSMLGLVRKYANRPETEWKALFYRILQSRIRDWYRRQSVRKKWLQWTGRGKQTDDNSQEDAIATLPDPNPDEPMQRVSLSDSMAELQTALHGLPLRQQQAFLLRTLEGLDVAETALAMGCSAGSVKTHYSRAIHRLREQLQDYQP